MANSKKVVAEATSRPTPAPTIKPTVTPVTAKPAGETVTVTITNNAKPVEPVTNEPTKVLFYKHVKKFKGVHVFFLYFFKLLFVLSILAMFGAIVMVPFIAPEGGTIPGLTDFGMEFGDLKSVFTITKDTIQPFIDDSSNFAALADVVDVVVWAILLVIGVIWAVILFLRVFIDMIFFFTKKKMTVIETLAKAQHKEYKLGCLKHNGIFIYALIVVGLIYFCTMLNVVFKDAQFLNDFKFFEPYQTAEFQNWGTSVVGASIALALIFGLVYRIARGVFKKKVKRHFGLCKKKKVKAKKA